MNAAKKLFTSKGYDNTTIIDILQEVGIGKGTFYHYFSSKEEVMNAVIMRMVESEESIVQAIADKPDLSAEKKILQILMALSNRDENKDKLIEELHRVDNAKMHQKSIAESILSLSPIIAGVVQQGINEGSFCTPYPKETVEMLFISLHFLLDAGIFRWSSSEIVDKVRAFAHMMEVALCARKGSFNYIVKIYQQAFE